MDKRIIRELIEEVLTIIKNDDVGITADLLDPTYRAGVEIGMTKEEMDTILDEA